MLMGNTYREGTLIYDQILRREKESEALEKYPEAIVQSHKTFVRKIGEALEANEIAVSEALKGVQQKHLDLEAAANEALSPTSSVRTFKQHCHLRCQ